MDLKLKKQLALLGLKADASHDQIRTAYKRQAAKAHPDRTGGTTEEFQALREAYQAIMQFHKRQQAIVKERARQQAAKNATLNRQRLAQAYEGKKQSASPASKASPSPAPKQSRNPVKPQRPKKPARAATRPPKPASKSNFWLWSLMLTGSLLLAVSGWQYYTSPPPEPAKPVERRPAKPAPPNPPEGHRTAYPDERLGSHYSLNFVSLFNQPYSGEIPPSTNQFAPPLQPVEVLEQLENHWLKVQYGAQQYYAREHLIGYGKPALAQLFDCTQYPLPRPQSGEVLAGQSGDQQLQVSNPHSLDALISFLNPQQELLQQVYLRSEDRIKLYQVPREAGRAVIEYGRFYNKTCGHFTAELSEKRLQISLLGGWQLLELP